MSGVPSFFLGPVAVVVVFVSSLFSLKRMSGVPSFFVFDDVAVVLFFVVVVVVGVDGAAAGGRGGGVFVLVVWAEAMPKERTVIRTKRNFFIL